MSPDVSYEMCGHRGCWHFVDDNPAFGDYPGLAEYEHLDDGEKEHDHDATPGGDIRTLDEWQRAHPELFTGYGDGKIGPNSALFPAPEEQPELYYGPRTRDDYCARRYRHAGRQCPNQVDFYVKIPDGRGSDWRKARAACTEHLAEVIWQMQQDHGMYDGEYLLRAARMEIEI